MIDPCDKNIKWTKKADMEMALSSMVDSLFSKGRIMEEYSETLHRGQPFPHYKELYKLHNGLLNDIVEIFFPEPVFTPSNINKQGTNEHYMFIVINAIFHMAWFKNLEAERDRGYEKSKKEVEKARLILSGYADSREINKLIHFPLHINEAIQQIEVMFNEIKRPQQGEKVVNKIKNYFGVNKITSTGYKKMIDANKKLHNELKKDYGLTGEEVRNIPFIGQLKTKI